MTRQSTIESRLALSMLFLVSACAEPRTDCRNCGRVVVAAVGEPTSLLPPLVFETVARDISDQLFERLANLEPGASPIDTAAYSPGLASRWERLDSLSWRFHLRPAARWQDGVPVAAGDVVFSFDAFSDSTLDAAARAYLAGRVRAVAEDSQTVRITFAKPSPEQLYDATYHVRVLPRHVWASIPRDRWAADSAVSHLVGSGPYRIDEWRRGQFLRLVADSLRIDWALPRIRQAVWRFAADPDAALNLVLSHQADLLETAGAPDRVQQVLRDTSLQVARYPTAIYGFLAFRVQDGAGRPHPLLGRREVRRALTEALNRPTIARALFGPGTRVPPGPMSQLLWIWDDKTRTLPFDSSRARAVLANAGRRIDILVPSTSSVRRRLAQVIQESWRKTGIEATITTVDFPVFQERLAKGQFDSYLGAYLDEPSPRGLADQWSRSGWGALNYGHYANPAFDSLLSKASETGDVASARQLWREAMDTLNADAPGIFLYAPENVAVLNRRLAGVKLDPYSWVSGLSRWGVGQERVLARVSVR